jgi:hypothetical protein
VHEYVATTVQRHVVIGKLAFIAFVASVGLGWVFHQLKLPTYIAPPAGTVAFGVIFWLYDQLLWKVKIWKFRVSGIPDLRGTWKGTIDIRRGEEVSDGVECTVTVKQTWRTISIEFATTDTSSHSLMAKIGTRSEGGLHYEYAVHAYPGARLEKDSKEKMIDHGGTARLKPENDDWTSLKGGYYNDEGFHRWGTYTLNRV